ncbi:MAG TPA: tetratricopeptide repeat protein [Victivallales bacterium]|nr:tetratricopeptide repeat protein [Victivallales bacterium]
MTKLAILLFGVLIFGAYTISAIDHEGLRKARNLEKDKRYEEAIAVYESLSEKAKDDIDDQQYLMAAVAIAKNSLKDKKKAVMLAERVKNPERRAFVLMSLFEPDAMITKYEDTDFMAWPDDIRAEAYKNRGNAYNSLKKYREALADFEKAFALPGGSNVVRGVSAKTSGDIYLSVIKDEAKAEEMYRNALLTTKAGYAWRNDALLKLTDILLKNKRNKEALALYEEVDTKNIEIPNWRIAMARGYSKALAANGEKLKALEQLNVALQAETKPEMKKKIQGEIDKLAEDML